MYLHSQQAGVECWSQAETNFSYLQFCQMSGESMRRLMQDQAYPGANE